MRLPVVARLVFLRRHRDINHDRVTTWFVPGFDPDGGRPSGLQAIADATIARYDIVEKMVQHHH